MILIINHYYKIYYFIHTNNLNKKYYLINFHKFNFKYLNFIHLNKYFLFAIVLEILEISLLAVRNFILIFFNLAINN